MNTKHLVILFIVSVLLSFFYTAFAQEYIGLNAEISPPPSYHNHGGDSSHDHTGVASTGFPHHLEDVDTGMIYTRAESLAGVGFGAAWAKASGYITHNIIPTYSGRYNIDFLFDVNGVVGAYVYYFSTDAFTFPITGGAAAQPLVWLNASIWDVTDGESVSFKSQTIYNLPSISFLFELNDLTYFNEQNRNNLYHITDNVHLIEGHEYELRGELQTGVACDAIFIAYSQAVAIFESHTFLWVDHEFPFIEGDVPIPLPKTVDGYVQLERININRIVLDGVIEDIRFSKPTYGWGETVEVFVDVFNPTNDSMHYLVALNLYNPNGNPIYDSHQLDEDIDHWINPNERTTFGPFQYTIPQSASTGTYHALAGLREHPWTEIEYRGLDWCQPEETFTVVTDDDSSGPGFYGLLTEPSAPIYDTHDDVIRIGAIVSDISNISSVQFMHGYEGIMDIYRDPSGHNTDDDGNGWYWYDIPLSEWRLHIGETLSWRIWAYDDDNDLPNDRYPSESAIQNIELLHYNHDPDEPSNPTPPDGTINQSINTALYWVSGDQDEDDVTYDIYFGTTSPPPYFDSVENQTFYDPGTLNFDQRYYWRIHAEDEYGASTWGQEWDFRTEPLPAPPEIGWSPSEFHFAGEFEGTAPDQTLSIWNAGGGTLNWEVSDDASWLYLSPSSGSSTGGTDEVNVSVILGGISGGGSATITITAVGATNSPIEIPVELEVGPPPPPPPRIGWSPNDFEFTAIQDRSNPPSQTLSIWNAGGGTLNWEVSYNALWLYLSPSSGSSTGEINNVSATADGGGLDDGVYETTITITASGATNSPQDIPVTLTVEPTPPEIVYDPDAFSFSGTEGGPNPPDQILSIYNFYGGATLNWEVSGDASWLHLSPSSGSQFGEQDEVSVSVDLSGLDADIYEATITITASGATNSPQYVPVTLIVNASGQLEILPSPDYFDSSGYVGGPFNPPSMDYTLTNIGGSPLDWIAYGVHEDDWIDISPLGGSLDPGESSIFTVSINSNADNLPEAEDFYHIYVHLEDVTNGRFDGRDVYLKVNALPGYLVVTPTDNFFSSGYEGGPFNPASMNYSLSNTGGSPIDVVMTQQYNREWITVPTSIFTLNPGSSITGPIYINNNANSLDAGNNSESVNFVNLTNGNGNTSRLVNLTVIPPIDSISPIPNPMTWANEPYETGLTSITMVATTATDDSPPIEYQFDFVSSPTGGTGGSDRDWGTNPTYMDDGLQPNHQYGYRVRARDSAPTPNVTGWSNVSYDYTDIETIADINFGSITTNSIAVRSLNTPSGLTRGSSGILIENVTNGSSSGWRQNNDYYTSSSLNPNTRYGFTARSRNGDEDPTIPCSPEYRYTLAHPPGFGSFTDVKTTSIRINWTSNGNPAGTQYFCQNMTNGDTSGWMSNTYWENTDLERCTSYAYIVWARNGDGVETSWANLGSQSTLCIDNEPPVAITCPDQWVQEDVLVTLDGSNSFDEDGTLEWFSWTQLSGTDVTLLDPNSFRTTFQSPYVGPSEPEGESLVFQLVVMDNEGSQSSDICVVSVSRQNLPPIADAGPSQKVNEDDLVMLSGENSYDFDGNIISYSWVQLSGSPVTLSNDNAINPVFNAPYVNSSGESLIFELFVKDDGGLQSRDICIINVLNENSPPVADAGGNITVGVNFLVTLNGSNSHDSDGGIEQYLWRQLSGPAVALSDSSEAHATFISPSVDFDGASLVFILTVIDNDGLTSQDICIVNVTWGNNPPVAKAGSDQEIKEGEWVSLNGEDSFDPDGSLQYHYWYQVSGSPVAIDIMSELLCGFTAPEVDAEGEFLDFGLIVIDDKGLISADTVTIQVKNKIGSDDPPKSSGGFCFIATAAYGTSLEPEVKILCHLRDEYLLKNGLGRLFVKTYYRISPSITQMISNHEVMKIMVRIGLYPVVGCSYVIVKTTLLQKLLIVFLLIIVIPGLFWVFRRRYRYHTND